MATTAPSDKLNIANEMLQFDRKNRGFYDDLTEDEQKKFSPFLMVRWGADVQGSPELQAYYLMSVNERLNKHFFLRYTIISFQKIIMNTTTIGNEDLMDVFNESEYTSKGKRNKKL